MDHDELKELMCQLRKFVRDLEEDCVGNCECQEDAYGYIEAASQRLVEIIGVDS